MYVLILFQLDRHPRYIEGYRLYYRPVGSAWMIQDVKAGPLHTAVLTELHRGKEYEFKMRPYYNEFQGIDSEIAVVHTPDEGKSCFDIQLESLDFSLHDFHFTLKLLL